MREDMSVFLSVDAAENKSLLEQHFMDLQSIEISEQNKGQLEEV